MSERDSIHRFLFERHAVRGELVHLNASWRAVVERGDYPLPVRDALGETLAAAVLLTSTLKFNGRLTLQLQSEGALSLLLAQCTSQMAIRGLAQHSDLAADTSFGDLTAGGRLAITIEPSDEGQRYQGIVPLIETGVGASVEEYFDRSEQLPTRLWLAASENAVVGMLLQQLPDESRPGGIRKDQDAWDRLTLLADTLKREELLGLNDREILHRLYHEEDVRLFEEAPVSFRCTCSRERIAEALRGLGQEEIDSIIEEQGAVSTTCEFCNKDYVFDAVDAAALFQIVPPDGSARSH